MSRRHFSLALIIASSIGVVLTSQLAVGWAEPSTSPTPVATAAQADTLLRQEIPYSTPNKAAPAKIGDELFLRRASLDLIGRLPTPEEVTAFVFDPAADKRAKIVTKLLADSRFGQNWGRYWRDVIMYRKTEERQQFLVGIPLDSYLADSLNANKPWSQIATEFITAKGGANEHGECGLIVAQQGQPEEIVGEVSRIFLAVQIQCAQCHDHPTDRWKREQFHELAAFFPRVASQPSRQGKGTGVPPEITVVATDGERSASRGPMNMRRVGTPEHRMSDPKNPSSEGTLMQPVLFATGHKLPVGTKDAERRASLAQWITAKDNSYFSQAFVNRLWSELTGEGFCEPVDDMGPDRTPLAPKTLDYLAKQFAATGYDVKWLFSTIMATDMYQLPSSPRRDSDDAPMQHNVAQRLRSDQVFDNLLLVLEASEPASPFGGMGGGGPRFAAGPRRQFTTAFGYDPSTRRDEIQSSIPQALNLMNSPTVTGALRGTGNTMLARKLSAISDDSALVQELYLRVLGREASQSELATFLQYRKQISSRPEAFEDILWSLLNTAEFLHRT